MGDLVAEMTEQRAVRLAHRLALTFTLGGVGLGRVEGDEAAGVPGQDRRLLRRGTDGGRQEIECETVGIFGPGFQRQAQPQQRIEQSALGEFDLTPMPEVLGTCEIGNGAVMAAGRAKRLGIVGGHEPVADIMLDIGAKPILLRRRRECTPRAVDLFQRGDGFPFRQVTQPQAAALTAGIFEIERLSAVLALEKLHGSGTLTARRHSTPRLC